MKYYYIIVCIIIFSFLGNFLTRRLSLDRYQSPCVGTSATSAEHTGNNDINCSVIVVAATCSSKVALAFAFCFSPLHVFIIYGKSVTR